MSSIEVAAGIGILGIFVFGVVIGIVLVVSFASRREDRLYSLWGDAPALSTFLNIEVAGMRRQNRRVTGCQPPAVRV